MPTPERFLNRLKELRTNHALEALNPGSGDQSEFGYGKACGIAQGLELAERLWNDETAQEEDDNGSKPRRSTP